MAHALPAEVRLYDHLLSQGEPSGKEEDGDFRDFLNPQSLRILSNCRVEASLGKATVGACFQFERQGYFCLDPDSSRERLVFNRTVSLRDTWAKLQSPREILRLDLS